MKPNQSRVSVQVNVTVDGEKVTTAKKARRMQVATGLNPLPFSVTSPTANGTLYVVQSGGINFIAANGGSLASSGSYPPVYAKAFPTPGVSPLDPANYSPPGDAVSTTPSASDGTWSFSAAVTPPGLVPGAAADSSVSGPPNSTLLVWYEYEVEIDIDVFELEYTVEAVNFRGVLSGGSGSGGAIVTALAATPAHLPTTKLVATFTGPLSALGPVKLTWNGVCWVGISSYGGGSVLSLTQVDKVYQLQGAGPAASFIVAGQATSIRPFSCTIAGIAVGSLHGSFKVTITE